MVRRVFLAAHGINPFKSSSVRPTKLGDRVASVFTHPVIDPVLTSKCDWCKSQGYEEGGR